jgi:hypothetical protein
MHDGWCREAGALELPTRPVGIAEVVAQAGSWAFERTTAAAVEATAARRIQTSIVFLSVQLRMHA